MLSIFIKQNIILNRKIGNDLKLLRVIDILNYTSYETDEKCEQINLRVFPMTLKDFH